MDSTTDIDILLRLVLLVAVLLIAFFTVRFFFFQPRLPTMAGMLPTTADLGIEPMAPERSGHHRARSLRDAMHIRSLARLVHFHARGAAGQLERIEVDGRIRWRAWVGAKSYGEAGVLRAEWQTRAGALRRLLNTIIAHGGVWVRA